MVLSRLQLALSEIKTKLSKLHDQKSLNEIPFENGMQNYHRLEIFLAHEFAKYPYFHRSALTTALNIAGHDFSEHGTKALLETLEPGRKADVKVLRETSEVLIGNELGFHNFSNQEEIPVDYQDTVHHILGEITASLAIANLRRTNKLPEIPRSLAINQKIPKNQKLDNYLRDSTDFPSLLIRTRLYLNSVYGRKLNPNAAPYKNYPEYKIVNNQVTINV